MIGTKQEMKISIIIPAYNCRKTIRKCVDSLLCQQGAELEIIVVNDGSTDDTLDQLQAYRDQIKLISIPNSGAAGARNVGLEAATGDFLMFLDADDSLKEHAISKLSEVQREKNADIVHFCYEYVYPDGKRFAPGSQVRKSFFAEKKDFPEAVYPMFWKGIYLNSVCMSMFRRSAVQGLSFRTELATAEDAFYSIAAFTRAENVQFISDILYEYSQSGKGLTGRGLSVFRKYRDNFAFARETAKRLKQWGMNTPGNYASVYLRPARVTFDKLERIFKLR